jgi:hypothetical protein
VEVSAQESCLFSDARSCDSTRRVFDLLLRQPRQRSVAAISVVQLHTTTVNHIVYVGSDSDFHYFFHSQLMGGDSYKVEKKLMRLPHEFTLSSGHEPVLLVGRFDEISGSWISPHLSPK